MGCGEFERRKITRLSTSEDELLAFLLVCTWVLATGRPFPLVPLQEMTEQELIDFWADDYSNPGDYDRSGAT